MEYDNQQPLRLGLCNCTEDSEIVENNTPTECPVCVDKLDVYRITLEAILSAFEHMIQHSQFGQSPSPCRIPTSCPPGFQGRYTVRSGDSMFSIAQRCGVTMQALINANPHIPNPSQIFPCDVLCVPPTCADTPSNCRIPSSCPPGFLGRYTVRSGDSMFSIAQRCGVTMQALINANPHISNPSQIFPCDVLCVPSRCANRTETDEPSD